MIVFGKKLLKSNRAEKKYLIGHKSVEDFEYLYFLHHLVIIQILYKLYM